MSTQEIDALLETDEAPDLLGALSVPHRDVIEDFVLEKLSYECISRKRGVPIGTVRSRIARARARIKALYAAGLKQEITHD